jgi:hypothetical protein
MPKKQIHVVSLSPFDKVETPEDVPSNEEEDINQIKEAIKEEESQQPEPISVKPKRKAAARKPKVEPVEPVIEQVEEPVIESPKVEQSKKVKTLELVKCDKCNKEMTKRTLRYDHPKTCKGAPINREDIPVQKRTKAPTKVVEPTIIPEDVIENEVKKRIQNTIQDRMQMKLKQKEERIKKLAEKIA